MLYPALPFRDLAPMFKYCKTGWTPRGDSCYMVILERASWFNSQEVCQEIGGDLVAIGSKVDNDFVFSLLAASNGEGTHTAEHPGT